ncbi:MAG TPA: choice-of-anchor V domain-containing protein [Candidatus Kapabacteria bacterium]|jgi:hypothetical protein|nr:choice-of-anchor V domain-containing protein [Candidatus Kapabacteria bacterium]
MMQLIPRVLVRKGFFVTIIFLLIGGYAVHRAVSHTTGEFGVSKTGCGGGGCHSSSRTASTIVTIATDSSEIIAGQTYVFSIMVKNANGIQKAAGCDISTDGSAKLAVNGANSGLQYYASHNELAHYTPRSFGNGDSTVWTFKYTAPTTAGTYHIYAAGNAVNYNSQADNGDLWNTTSYVVTVASAAVATGPSDNNSAWSIAPNPARDHVAISAPSEVDRADLEVVDAAGRAVLLQNDAPLSSAYTLDLHSLSSGTYFLWVRPHSGEAFVRQFVIRK